MWPLKSTAKGYPDAADSGSEVLVMPQTLHGSIIHIVPERAAKGATNAQKEALITWTTWTQQEALRRWKMPEDRRVGHATIRDVMCRRASLSSSRAFGSLRS